MIGIRMMVMDKSFEDKVKDKLENDRVKDVVKQIENQPTDIKMDIPPNPFNNGDGESEYESEELDYNQNVLLQQYLKKNGFKDFSDWWKKVGRDSVNEIISDIRINNNDIDYKDEDKYWYDYFMKNRDDIIYQIIWGDTDVRKNQK